MIIAEHQSHLLKDIATWSNIFLKTLITFIVDFKSKTLLTLIIKNFMCNTRAWSWISINLFKLILQILSFWTFWIKMTMIDMMFCLSLRRTQTCVEQVWIFLFAESLLFLDRSLWLSMIEHLKKSWCLYMRSKIKNCFLINNVKCELDYNRLIFQKKLQLSLRQIGQGYEIWALFRNDALNKSTLQSLIHNLNDRN